MAEEPRFRSPQLAINRVYTRHGDAGRTRLVGGQTVDKDDARIEAYGTVDELNAEVGAAALEAEAEGHAELAATLRRVQNGLFNLGSLLATRPDDLGPQQPRIVAADVDALEAEIDRCNADLPPLRSFVLSGGSGSNVALHRCRTICRRAERRCVTLARAEEVDPVALAWLNRLGDAFFVWSRWVVVRAGGLEVLWSPDAVG